MALDGLSDKLIKRPLLLLLMLMLMPCSELMFLGTKYISTITPEQRQQLFQNGQHGTDPWSLATSRPCTRQWLVMTADVPAAAGEKVERGANLSPTLWAAVARRRFGFMPRTLRAHPIHQPAPTLPTMDPKRERFPAVQRMGRIGEGYDKTN